MAAGSRMDPTSKLQSCLASFDAGATPESVYGLAYLLSHVVGEDEAAMLRSAVAEADVVITTALIPNRPAPVLVKAEAVATMRRGSVMVDLAAENGGNIEGTVKDQVWLG